MRVLLHNCENQLYYAGSAGWTDDLWQAFDFGSIERAVKSYKEKRVAFAEVVLDVGPNPGNVAFSLPDRCEA